MAAIRMPVAGAEQRGAGRTVAGDVRGPVTATPWPAHFGLSHDPFVEESLEYYYGARYGVASLRLEQALENASGFVLITGPAGVGKSALLRSVLRRGPLLAHATVSAGRQAPASVIDVLLRSREPIDGLDASTRKRAALLGLIEQGEHSGRAVVCVIEDAHAASVSQLAELLRAVSGIPGAASVLQIVLVGRPPLSRTLEATSLAPLAERITTRIELEPLSTGEVSEFLTDRLELAGAINIDRILSPQAVAAVARYSHGAPGLCMGLARAAMEITATAGYMTVSAEHVDQAAARYFRRNRGMPAWSVSGSSRTWITSAAVAGIILLALVVAAAQVRMIGSDQRPIQAALGPLPHRPSATSDLEELAQRRSPRDEFLAGTPYEVEIKPPPRPVERTNPEVEPLEPEPAEESADTAPGQRPTTIERMIEQNELPPAPGPRSSPPVRVMGNQPGAPPMPAAGPSPAPLRPPAAPQGLASSPSPPFVSLQVGAFRDLHSARNMEKALQARFPDVFISTADSGGEPLHRVRVGRFHTPEETLPLKQQLQAAGYPSFRVTEN
jgi:type II secretory pathway predicted ATPase ExeA/cell division septation protein DedD